MSQGRNPVGWFEIYVQDIGRAKAFYEETFGVTLEKLESPELEMWAFPMLPDGPGCPGAVVKMRGADAAATGTLVYFSCADCGVSARGAKAAGGEIVRDKFSIGQHGFIALVKDSEGNMVGLHSMQ